MNTPPVPTAPASMTTAIDIDWPALMEQRQTVLAHSDMPPYLLLPEIHILLDAAVQDDLHLLINTLWHTGARVSEALALTPDHFQLDARLPHVSIQTLKKRGRPSKRSAARKPRLVPLADAAYLTQLQRYFASHRTRRSERLWPVTRDAVNKRFDRLTRRLDRPLSIRLTPHVLRHSFGVNAVLHGIPLTVLQGWLGHADISSTQIYTQVLTLETHHLMRRIRF